MSRSVGVPRAVRAPGLLASPPCRSGARPAVERDLLTLQAQPKAATSQPSHLRRLQSQNGGQQVPLSTATVSMVHSVPELMVSSEVSAARGPGQVEGWGACRALVVSSPT